MKNFPDNSFLEIYLLSLFFCLKKQLSYIAGPGFFGPYRSSTISVDGDGGVHGQVYLPGRNAWLSLSTWEGCMVKSVDRGGGHAYFWFHIVWIRILIRPSEWPMRPFWPHTLAAHWESTRNTGWPGRPCVSSLILRTSGSAALWVITIVISFMLWL